MTKKDKKSGAHINRRSFLKGVAATGAMATMTEGYMLGERLAEI